MGSEKYSFKSDEMNIQIIENPTGNVSQINKGQPRDDNEDIIIQILKANSSEFEELFSRANKQYSKMNENEIRQKIQIYVNQEIDSEEKKKSFIEKVGNSAYNIAESFVGKILLEVIKKKVFGL